jgi:predicted ArsR family transcriptional regulator
MGMLNKLLALLNEGGTQRVSDLAQELGTTAELVEAMLEDLERMGYIKSVNGSCSDKCATCPMADSCAAGAGGEQIWTLVDRSKKTT